MTVKQLTGHHKEFLSLKGGCRGSSESTHVKMPHCWKSHALVHFFNLFQGGTIGFTTSLAFLLWISLGGIITKTSVVIKPELSTEGCNWNISGLASPSTSPVNTVTPQTIEATTSVYDKYS